MSEVDLLRKKIKRIQKAQEEAELLLEKKSQELYELNKNLEKQVVERTKEFERARDEAVAASKAKSQFLSNMSHEIRTPLNGMLGFIGLLEKSSLTRVQQEQLSVVSKSGNLLLGLISDILDFSKIEAGKLEIDSSKFDLKKSVENVLDVMSNQVFDKNLEFLISVDEAIPKHLVGDEARVRQVLINLIGNAVKFTPTGEITVKVQSRGVTSDGRQKVYFEVQDTGVGISANKLDSIFSAFEQADVTDTRKYGGTGLGLTISQQIVSAMGGVLQVASEETVGSKFFFEISLEVSADEETESSLVTFATDMEVAVFAPNSLVQNNIIERLEDWAITCTSVERLEEIKWKKDNPLARNLILDHCFLIDDQGLGCLKKILELGVHVMIFAPPKDKANLSERLNGLAVDILSKPIKKEELFDSIAKKTTLLDKQVAQKASELPKVSTGQTHLLLVEDNLINQLVALAMLKVHGYSVDVANNGKEAAEMFDPQKHQLILMDCQMPVMDGFDAARAVRKRDPSVPIVAMTANAFKKTKEMCFEAGMSEFVTKPISDESLAAVIKKTLLHTKAL